MYQKSKQIVEMLNRAGKFYGMKDGLCGRIGFVHGRSVVLEGIRHELIRPERSTKSNLDLKMATIAAYHTFRREFIQGFPVQDVGRYRDVKDGLEIFQQLRDFDTDDSVKINDYYPLIKAPNLGLLVRLVDFGLYATIDAVELESLRKLDPRYFYVTGMNSDKEYKMVARRAEAIYAPFADFYGLRRLAGDLHLMAAQILRLKLLQGVIAVLDEMEPQIKNTQDFLFNSVEKRIAEKLVEAGFTFKAVERDEKHKGKIVKKLVDRNFVSDHELQTIKNAMENDVHDLVALKLILLARDGSEANAQDILDAAGMITEILEDYKRRGEVRYFTPDDRITEPKDNGYSSYHFDLALRHGYVNSEIILRDRRRDDYAEHGDAVAHHMYKGGSELHRKAAERHTGFAKALMNGNMGGLFMRPNGTTRSVKVKVINGNESREVVLREDAIVADAIVEAGYDISNAKPEGVSFFDRIDGLPVIKIVKMAANDGRLVLGQIISHATYPATVQEVKGLLKNHRY